jgi:hypothetical protein
MNKNTDDENNIILKAPTIEYLLGLKSRNKCLIAQIEDNINRYIEIMEFINDNCDYTYVTVELINFYNDLSEKAQEEMKYLIFINENTNKQINQVCKHNFVTDIIDIAPDKDQSICYCTICELNK